MHVDDGLAERTSELSTLWAFVRMSFKTSFAYRSSVFIGILGSLFSVLVQIAIWSYIFQTDVAMIRYMIAYVVVSQLLGQVYVDLISVRIGDKIKTGDLAVDLIKPLNPILIYWSTALGVTLSNVLTRGLPVLVLFSPVFLYAGINPLKVPLFVVLCLVGYVLSGLIFALVGHLAFVITELWAFSRMLRDTIRFFSGAIIPLAFFPPVLAAWANFLPFHLLYSFPIRFLLEEMPGPEIMWSIVLMGGWLVALSMVLKLVSQRAVWRAVIQGG